LLGAASHARGNIDGAGRLTRSTTGRQLLMGTSNAIDPNVSIARCALRGQRLADLRRRSRDL